ncbi:hypothetical protein FAM93_15880 [Salmonella enterica]|nr:hypothetical protein [Salmonella enterica]
MISKCEWHDYAGYLQSHDLSRSAGYREQCGVNKAWWLMQRVEIKAQVGYRSPRARGDSFY